MRKKEKNYKPVNISNKFKLGIKGRLKNIGRRFPMIVTRQSLQELLEEVREEVERRFHHVNKEDATDDYGKIERAIPGEGPWNAMSHYEGIAEDHFYGNKESWLHKQVMEYVSNQGVEFKEDKKEDMEVINAIERIIGGFLGLVGGFASGADFTITQTIAMQRASNLRYLLDPHANSAIVNRRNYVIGQGVKFQSGIPEVQEYLEEVYWRDNQMEKWHKDRYELILRQGEWFNRYVPRGEGEEFGMAVFSLETDHIGDIEIGEHRFPLAFKWLDTSQLNRSKLETIWYPDAFLEETTKTLGLKSKLFSVAEKDGTAGVINPATGEGTDKEKRESKEFVYHMKLGTGVRGYPYLAPTLRFFQYYDDFVKDIGRLHHEQARVIFIKWISADRSLEVDETPHPTPRGGVMLEAVKGRLEYEFKAPVIKVDKNDGRLFRLSISAGVQIPEHILWQDSNSAVYASIHESKTPFSISVLNDQDTYAGFMDDEARIFLREGVRFGRLKPEYTVQMFGDTVIAEASAFLEEVLGRENFDTREVINQLEGILGEPEKKTVQTTDLILAWEFPQIVESDPLKAAQAAQVWWQIGIDTETLATKGGFDWKVVLGRKLKERQRRLNEMEEERAKFTHGQPGDDDDLFGEE